MDARPTYKPQNYKTHRKQHSKKKKVGNLGFGSSFLDRTPSSTFHERKKNEVGLHQN